MAVVIMILGLRVTMRYVDTTSSGPRVGWHRLAWEDSLTIGILMSHLAPALLMRAMTNFLLVTILPAGTGPPISRWWKGGQLAKAIARQRNFLAHMTSRYAAGMTDYIITKLCPSSVVADYPSGRSAGGLSA